MGDGLGVLFVLEDNWQTRCVHQQQGDVLRQQVGFGQDRGIDVWIVSAMQRKEGGVRNGGREREESCERSYLISL